MLLSLLRKTLAPFGAVLVIVIILLMARARFSFLRAIPMWIWLSIFALIFVVWMGVVFFKWMAEKRRAKAIEDGILDQAQQGADQASPARRAEIEELKRSLAEALIMLKKGPQGNKALYSLPWYLIIGPPAIGKTTAIVNSGLNFPNMTTAKRMRGAGGTRNCDCGFPPMQFSSIQPAVTPRVLIEAKPKLNGLVFSICLKHTERKARSTG